MALMSTFFDDFSTGTLAKWDSLNKWGTITATSNQMNITVNTGASNYSGINSPTSYDLTGSYLACQVVDAGNQALTSLEVFPVYVKTFDNNNKLFWLISQNTARCYKRVSGGTNTQVGTSLSYSAATHKYFRIREASGTTYWEWSTDSRTWTTHYSVANPIGVTSLYVEASAGTYATTASATTVILDNFNVFNLIKTQTAIAKISNGVVTKTQTGISRIAVKPTKTQPAIANIIQTANIQRLTGQSASGSTGTDTVTINYPSPPTQGNLLIAVLYSTANSAQQSITGWNKDASISDFSQHGLCIFSKVAGASESSAVTANSAVTSGSMHMVIHEYSGLATVSPLDRTVTATSSNTAVNTLAIGPTATTTEADELWIAAGGVAGTGTVPLWSNSFNARTSTTRSFSADRIVSAPGTASTTFDFTGTAALTNGLIATYRAAGGTDLTKTQTATARIATNPTKTQTGKANILAVVPTSLRFNGTSNYAEIADHSDFSVATTGQLTISFWMRPDDTTFPKWDGSGGDRYVQTVSKLDVDAGGQREWEFRMYSDDNTVGRANRISFYVFQANTSIGIGSFFQEQVTPGQWIHVTGTVDGTNTKIYKNGVLKDTDNYTSLTMSDTHSPVRIGTGNRVGYANPCYFMGAIDDVRVWNRALSAGEVATVAANGSVPSGLVSQYDMNETGSTIVDSVGGHNGTFNGVRDRDHVTVISPDDISSPSLHFNGTSSYIQIADRTAYSIPTTNAFSVQVWFNPDTDQFVNAEDTGYVNFVSKFTYDTVNAAEWEFRIYNKVNSEGDGRDNELSFYVFNPSGGLGTSGDAPKSNLNTSHWIHLVGVVDNVARTVKMYRDGVLTETASLATPINIAPGNTVSPLRIGRGASSSAFFQGLIKDVRIWNKALSGAEVTNLYSGAHNAASSNLVGWWKLTEGVGTTAYDSIGSNDATIVNGAWPTIKTQPATARVVQAGAKTKTQTARARVAKILTKTQSAVSRVGPPIKTKTQSAIARIRKIVTKTQTGKASITGTGGTLPAPLTVGTNYYVVVTGPDTFALAPTYTDALANTNLIDLTNTGSGTISLVTLDNREIQINNNEILDDDREDLIGPLYNTLSGISWSEVKADTVGLGWHEVGDVVKFTQGSVTVQAFLKEIHLTLSGGVAENLVSTIPDVASIDYQTAGGVLKSVYNTEIKVDKQNQTITSVVSRQDSIDGIVTEEFTRMTQDIANVLFTIQRAGSGNLILNSVGFAKEPKTDGDNVDYEALSFWTYNTGYKIGTHGSLTSYSSSESQNAGGISGQVLEFNGDGITIEQRIGVAANTALSIGLRVKKALGSGGATITIYNDIDSRVITVDNLTNYVWEELKIEDFVSTMPFLNIKIEADDATHLQITDLRLMYGSALQGWQQSHSEILATNVQFSTLGMKIFDNVHETETQVTYNEFSTRRKSDDKVLFEADDSGVVTNDLTVRGSTTYQDSNEVAVIRQITIPHDNDRAGIAFIGVK